MRIADLLYFAPGIKFADVDLNGRALSGHYRRRIVGFYVEPAEECAGRGQAFAAGVLLVSCVDALARIRFNNPRVGDRIRRFARQELASFGNADIANRLYQEFRNGLVHEGRIKNGGQFSLETGSTVEDHGGLLLINPRCLAAELRTAIDSYAALLDHDAAARQHLADALARDHARDFAAL